MNANTNLEFQNLYSAGIKVRFSTDSNIWFYSVFFRVIKLFEKFKATMRVSRIILCFITSHIVFLAEYEL